jgi:hypothetical protein
MVREFRNAHFHKINLSNNPKHNFALNHTLSIFKANAAYTFIPKNACSAMRYSIAVANGCINNLEDLHWIHANNPTFSVDTKAAAVADYTFVILRCPIDRLYSVFMDKIVGLTNQAWGLCSSGGYKIRPYDVSFKMFVNYLHGKNSQQMDIHWRPQSDFLLYKNYDHIFCLEQFSSMQKQLLSDINFTVYDVRKELGHDTKKLKYNDTIDRPEFKSALELLNLKEAGFRPKETDIITPDLAQKVFEIYSEDVELYCNLFGKSKLMLDLGF